MSDNYGEFTPERLALLACARAWVAETPDAARMDTVSRVAAEIRAAEERGRRRGVEERDELLREAMSVLRLWPSDVQFGRDHARDVCVRIDAALAPPDSGKDRP